MKLLLKLLTRKMLRRAKKSVTAALGTGVFGVGVLDAIRPEMLDMVPAPLRDYAFLILGVLIVLARLRTEITEALSEAKNAAK